MESKGQEEFHGRAVLLSGLALAGDANALEEGGGSYRRDRAGDRGLEDAAEGALNGMWIGEGPEADGGGSARLLATLLPLVSEAKRVAGESDGAAGRCIGLGV